MLQKHTLSLAKSVLVENKRKELQRPPKSQYLYPVLFRVSLVQCTELDDTIHAFVTLALVTVHICSHDTYK